MAFFLNKYKLKTIVFNSDKMNNCYFNNNKILFSDIAVKIRIKTPESSDKFNDTIIFEKKYDDGIDHCLADFLDSTYSKIINDVPWNRYELETFEYDDGKEIGLSDPILEETIVNMKTKHKDIPISFVGAPHITVLNKNLYVKHFDLVQLPSLQQNNLYIKYDEGYEADGDPKIEELVISEDGKTESWVSTTRHISTINYVKNLYCVNPIRVTLRAKRKQYHVCLFLSNNGYFDKSYCVNHGDKVDLGVNSEPEKEGYIFLGYYTDKNLTKDFDLNSPIVSDLDLYPKWKPKQYNITFDGNGLVDTVTYKMDFASEISFPTGLKADGYTWEGWSETPDCKNAINLVYPRYVHGDTTYYAKWTLNEYRVEFNENGHGKYSKVLVKHGDTVNEPTMNDEEHYTFKGWFVDKECTKAYDFKTPVVKSIMLYAKWKGDECKVIFDTNGHGNNTVAIVEYNQTVGEPTNITAEGYTCLGWYTDPKCENSYYFGKRITNDVTLYAKWKQNEYSVKFNANGHGQNSEVLIKHGDKINKPANLVDDGYTFNGWFTDTECAKAYDFNSPVVNNITLYAKWTKKVLSTVKFYWDTGSGRKYTKKQVPISSAIGELPTCAYHNDTTPRLDKAQGTLHCEYGYNDQKNTVKVPYMRTGKYNFRGWYYYDDNDNSILMTPDTIITNDMECYGKFSEICGFQSVNLPTFTRDGYKMLGFYSEKTGGVKLAENGGTYKPPRSGTHIYAHWEKI